MTTEGGRLDPVVRTFMQMLQEGRIDYASKLQEIDDRIRALKAGGSRKNEPGGVAKILSFGKYCIEWYQGKHTADKYYREPPEFAMTPDTVEQKLKGLIDSRRKLAAAHALLADTQAAERVRATAEPSEAARHEIGPRGR